MNSYCNWADNLLNHLHIFILLLSQKILNAVAYQVCLSDCYSLIKADFIYQPLLYTVIIILCVYGQSQGQSQHEYRP